MRFDVPKCFFHPGTGIQPTSVRVCGHTAHTNPNHCLRGGENFVIERSEAIAQPGTRRARSASTKVNIRRASCRLAPRSHCPLVSSPPVDEHRALILADQPIIDGKALSILFPEPRLPFTSLTTPTRKCLAHLSGSIVRHVRLLPFLSHTESIRFCSPL